MMFWLLLCTLLQIVTGFTHQKTSTSYNTNSSGRTRNQIKIPKYQAILEGMNLNVKILLLTQRESKAQNKWSVLAATFNLGMR